MDKYFKIFNRIRTATLGEFLGLVGDSVFHHNLWCNLRLYLPVSLSNLDSTFILHYYEYLVESGFCASLFNRLSRYKSKRCVGELVSSELSLVVDYFRGCGWSEEMIGNFFEADYTSLYMSNTSVVRNSVVLQYCYLCDKFSLTELEQSYVSAVSDLDLRSYVGAYLPFDVIEEIIYRVLPLCRYSIIKLLRLTKLSKSSYYYVCKKSDRLRSIK